MTFRSSPVRIRTPRGQYVWQVSNYEDVRALLGDSRMSRHPTPETAGHSIQAAIFGQLPPDHNARMRRAFSAMFTRDRMARLRPSIRRIAVRLFTEIEHSGPPSDLTRSFALPLAGFAITEFLGIPREDRDKFIRLTRSAGRVHGSVLDTVSVDGLTAMMRSIVTQRRKSPSRDAISTMNATLSDVEIIGVSVGLMFGGYETTAAAINRGVKLLLSGPRHVERIQNDLGLASSAVEEILRVVAPPDDLVRPGEGGLPRYATIDLEIGTETVRAGELILLDIRAANQDRNRFLEPTAFDIYRANNAHLSFGHGSYYCPGAPLARVILQEAVKAVVRAFARLRFDLQTDSTESANASVAHVLVRW